MPATPSEENAARFADYRPPARGLLPRLLGPLDRWFSDKRRSVSRPKLLFAVSTFDALIVMAAGVLAMAIKSPASTTSTKAATCVLLGLAVTAVLNGLWAYSVSSLRNSGTQARKIIEALAIVFCATAGASFLAGRPVFMPALAFLWIAAAGTGLIVSRMAVARVLDHLTRAGRLVRRTVVVGGGPEAEALIQALNGDPSGSLQILGVFDDRMDQRSADSFAGHAKLGTFDQLAAFCQNAGVDLLIVSIPTSAEDRLLHILQRLFTLPVDVRISALGSKLRLNARAYTRIAGVPMLAVMDKPLTDWDRLVKSVEDRVLSAVFLLALAPVLAAVALAIRLDSRGPVFFRQKRYGFNNELVEVYKFRSLRTDQSDATAARLVTKDDPRVTRVGRFIRRTSLDELPQLINVLKGEMSLVGPRPHAEAAKAGARLYHDVVQGYLARHRVKPGVTGWAQINGWRGETDTEEKIQRRVEHDLYYIDNWSVMLDLYIIAMTPIALATDKNAY